MAGTAILRISRLPYARRRPSPTLRPRNESVLSRKGKQGYRRRKETHVLGIGSALSYTTGRVRTKTSANPHFQRMAGKLYLGGSSYTHRQGSRVSYWGGRLPLSPTGGHASSEAPQAEFTKRQGNTIFVWETGSERSSSEFSGFRMRDGGPAQPCDAGT